MINGLGHYSDFVLLLDMLLNCDPADCLVGPSSIIDAIQSRCNVMQ